MDSWLTLNVSLCLIDKCLWKFEMHVKAVRMRWRRWGWRWRVIRKYYYIKSRMSLFYKYKKRLANNELTEEYFWQNPIYITEKRNDKICVCTQIQSSHVDEGVLWFKAPGIGCKDSLQQVDSVAVARPSAGRWLTLIRSKRGFFSICTEFQAFLKPFRCDRHFFLCAPFSASSFCTILRFTCLSVAERARNESYIQDALDEPVLMKENAAAHSPVYGFQTNAHTHEEQVLS